MSNFDVFKKFLIHPKSSISKEEQAVIIENIFDFFLSFQNDILYINNGEIGKIKSKTVFETILKMHLIETFPNTQILIYNEEESKYRWNLKKDDIYNALLTFNSYELIQYESNLFAKKQEVLKNSLTKTITVITNKLHIKEIVKPNISEFEYSEILNDYKTHFPFFDDFLKLIIDMRFAKDRKASFLHIRVKSNWGKSFLSGLLQNLQVGFEVDYHNLINKGANDISPIQVRNSFVLILDEFNNFSAEMKKLSHDFRFAPKFGMTEKVELFLKILLSAEKSPSFSDGVDSQIINRVMSFDIHDEQTTELTSRKIYQKFGNAKYMKALEFYAYERLTSSRDEFLALEEFEAHKIADERVTVTLNEYKMKNVVNLEEEISGILEEEISSILNKEISSPKIESIAKNISLIEGGLYEKCIFIKQPKRTIETILKCCTAESDYKKMKYKTNNLEAILPIVSDNRQKPIKIRNKSQKGVILSYQDALTAKEILKNLDKDGLLIIDQEIF